jgi:hypothetical protein
VKGDETERVGRHSKGGRTGGAGRGGSKGAPTTQGRSLLGCFLKQSKQQEFSHVTNPSPLTQTYTHACARTHNGHMHQDAHAAARLRTDTRTASSEPADPMLFPAAPTTA